MQLIKNPIEPLFNNLVKEANSKVILCAPFIKLDIVRKILKNKKEGTKLIVITTSNITNYVRNASDIEAIEMLLDNNIKVYNHQNLHAKIYSFDDYKAIITSSNLTFKGLNKNYEYGVLIDDKNTIALLENDIKCLIKSELSGEIKYDDVLFIKEQVKFYKETEYKIVVDKDGDEQINSKNKNILSMLKSWQKDIYEIIEKLPDVFKLQDIYAYEKELKLLHPKNNNIKDKIRQTLQYLRDKGIIKFIKRGSYKKLIK